MGAYVAHQVAQHLAEARLVGPDEEGALRADGDRAVGLLGAEVGGGVADQAGEVDVLTGPGAYLLGTASPSSASRARQVVVGKGPLVYDVEPAGVAEGEVDAVNQLRPDRL
jgi:hypothetical protein